MRSSIHFCALAMVPPYYDKLIWEKCLAGRAIGLAKCANVIEEWDFWALHPNDDMETRPHVDVIENQHFPM